MNEIIRINNNDLQIKEFKGQRVITFKDIDRVHERTEGTAKRNFSENKKHFIENIDYFLVKGNELKELKQSTNFVLSNAKEIILITESGYLMLVKSLTDDLAWKVQRELVNKYFRIRENDFGELSTEMKALLMHDKKIQAVQKEVMEVKEDLTEFKEDLPLFTSECEEVSRTVKRIGTRVLGGKGSKAYNNKSLRAKVYSDIHRQLKREFDVNSYKAIKRRYLNEVIDIVENYKSTIALNEQISMLNNQVVFSQ
ncbi:putative antirepressor,ORF6C domain [[Clostridium] sordellii]|uniref:ORF6C domain-containing protein n=1 Tax=Paraclostridium sordellii TaxID=1505 RepID=UPI0005433051|nr:ORF6C domain-containing protein [Paeniclostridium sordellii]CEK35727.1 putative antirepressor,ORF6C domain [[Clostridium] sordellii] [Paeniclostridium sordellii]